MFAGLNQGVKYKKMIGVDGALPLSFIDKFISIENKYSGIIELFNDILMWHILQKEHKYYLIINNMLNNFKFLYEKKYALLRKNEESIYKFIKMEKNNKFNKLSCMSLGFAILGNHILDYDIYCKPVSFGSLSKIKLS
jgi:hypothetical protein